MCVLWGIVLQSVDSNSVSFDIYISNYISFLIYIFVFVHVSGKFG
jgi:hypothetical protein